MMNVRYIVEKRTGFAMYPERIWCLVDVYTDTICERGESYATMCAAAYRLNRR
jgi:hypothetical protein